MSRALQQAQAELETAIDRLAAAPVGQPQSLGAPASPSGSTLQPPAAASAAIPSADSELLSIAITHLAEWCHAIDKNGTGWDDWDEHYKDAAYRPGPLRALIDAKLAELRKRDVKEQE